LFGSGEEEEKKDEQVEKPSRNKVVIFWQNEEKVLNEIARNVIPSITGVGGDGSLEPVVQLSIPELEEPVIATTHPKRKSAMRNSSGLSLLTTSNNGVAKDVVTSPTGKDNRKRRSVFESTMDTDSTLHTFDHVK
jgi:hypothetical protein